MRRNALITQVALAAVVIVGVVAQIYLAAAHTFGAADALEAHRGLGHSVIGLAVLAGALGVYVWWGNRARVVTSVALAVAAVLLLAFVEADAWVGAIHGLLAVVVLGLAAHVAATGMLTLRRDRAAR